MLSTLWGEELQITIKRTLVLAAALATIFLAACDNEQPKKPSGSSNYKIVSANGKTFYLNTKDGKIYVFGNQEFVELPTREPKAAPAEQSVKELSSPVKDLDVTAKLKFFDEKLLFFVQIDPQETEEYKQYRHDFLTHLYAALKESEEYAEKQPDAPGTNPDTDDTSEKTTELPPLVEPKNRYKNSNWEKYWDIQGNFVRAHLEDADGFPVTTIDVFLSGSTLQRTQLVDDDEKAEGYSYYGEVPLTLPAFQRIETLSVTWRLDAKK